MSGDPMDALKRYQRPNPWGGDEEIHGPALHAWSGIVDGWSWATDSHTAAGLRTDAASSGPPDLGRKVVEVLTSSAPPTHTVRLTDLTQCGGIGLVPEWGHFNLGMVLRAAWWVADADQLYDALDEDSPRPDVAIGARVEPHQSATRLTVSFGDRVAVVVGCVPKGWCPTIDLPLDPVGAGLDDSAGRS